MGHSFYPLRAAMRISAANFTPLRRTNWRQINRAREAAEGSKRGRERWKRQQCGRVQVRKGVIYCMCAAN